MGNRSLIVALSALAAVAACKSKDEPAKGTDQATAKGTDKATAKATAKATGEVKPLPPLGADPGSGDGALAWAVGFGGLTEDVARDVAVNAAGVVVCGDFEAKGTFGALGERTATGGSDAIAMQLDPGGKPLWITQGGGTGEDTCDAIAVGADGTIAIAGLFSDSFKVGELEVKSNGSDDVYLATLGPDGVEKGLFATGGDGKDMAMAVAATPDGGFVVGGAFFSVMTVGDVDLASEGKEDAFVIKLDASGQVEWAKRYGGPELDAVMRLAVDAQGSIYAGVLFDRRTAFAEPLESKGSFDIALVKLDAAGDVIWAKGIGGPDDDGVAGLAVDPAGNVTLAGAFSKSIEIEGTTHKAAGKNDALVVRYGADGKLAWSKALGGTGDDTAGAVAADAAGNVIVGGWFSAPEQGEQVDLGKGKTRPTGDVGNADAFVVKLAPDGNAVWVQTFGDRDVDKVRALAVDAEGTPYAVGVYRFKLSAGATSIESVHAPNDKAPMADGYVVKLSR